MKNNTTPKKPLAFVLAMALIVLSLAALASCGGTTTYTEDEIRAALEELLPKSEELNEIYFGEGLPPAEDPERLNDFYSKLDSDVKSINYYPVDTSAGYENETQLREATLEVFTEGYSEYLFERAFKGISAVYDEGTDTEYRMTSSYARYIEENGFLTVRIDAAEEAIPLGRVYDLSSITIIREKDSSVTVSIPTTLDGEPLEVELTLVHTDSGWRLDSPTY